MAHDQHPRVRLAYVPTPLEPMPNLSKHLGGANLFVKRDDCTGLAFGGNKVRHLEYTFGQALERGADVVVTSGALQSNFASGTAAVARKLGMGCEILHENRVPGMDDTYRESGNVLLLKLMGVRVHSHPVGEDEEGADEELERIAERIRSEGGTPYVVPTSPRHPPLGALGYVDMIAELLEQARDRELSINAIVMPTGSATTHAGVLVGLRSMGSDIRVYGICVRRDAKRQRARALDVARAAGALLDQPDLVGEDDIWVTDSALAPGYGQPSPAIIEAIRLAARYEGLFVDPVYTGKTLAGLIGLVRDGFFGPDQNVVFLHTGGTPALFGYTGIFKDL